MLDEARLKRVFDAALAERTAQELLADEVGDQANWKALPQKRQRRANT